MGTTRGIGCLDNLFDPSEISLNQKRQYPPKGNNTTLLAKIGEFFTYL
jgi:hypothetical protein